ncbi:MULTISPECIES: sulfatase family protein [unclassified Saccharicrinis]|uniref:sulfatase family protein n=1 Tax=unclassified Saccharicrinis TaxID=2646859 RepID=UPI003D3276F2
MKNLFVLLILGSLIMTGGCKKEANPPNIIVFLADDLGYGDLGCYGNPIIKTPNIDMLATEGVRMTDCHSGGTVCSPSRAALLTGRNPYRSGFFYIHGKKTYLKEQEVTIAELLHEHGYETAFWGKWHLSTLEKNRYSHPGPSEQGFDYWMGTTLNAFGGPKNYKKFIKNGEPVGEVEGWYCDVIVDDAREWLKSKRDKEKPFFMYVCSHEPHTPIAPPIEYSAKYDNAKVNKLEKGMKYGRVARPQKDISEYKKEYYGTVNQLDDAFGRLMHTLEELELKENTLVLFTSDNGPEAPVTTEESLGNWDDPIRDKCFGTPGELRGMKRFPYEGGHRVPGIVRFPGVIPEGTTSRELFNGCDILPTICQLVEIPVPTNRNIDGSNAFNAFLNKKVDRVASPIWFYPNHEDTYFRMPQVAMRKDNYTLIGWLPEKTDSLDLKQWIAKNDPVKFELYNMNTDPAQTNNIANEHNDIVENMKQEMIAQWREMRDEGLETIQNN